MSSTGSGSMSSASQRGQVQELSLRADVPTAIPMTIAAGASTRFNPRAQANATETINEVIQNVTFTTFHIAFGGVGVTWHLHE
jgi:hypothetical protein